MTPEDFKKGIEVMKEKAVEYSVSLLNPEIAIDVDIDKDERVIKGKIEFTPAFENVEEGLINLENKFLEKTIIGIFGIDNLTVSNIKRLSILNVEYKKEKELYRICLDKEPLLIVFVDLNGFYSKLL